ncbi:MAG: ABC transporter substrate-binding protein [Alphaproteobacteria bacterium]
MKRHLMMMAAGVVVSAPAFADEIDFLCYQDGNECEVIADMSAEFTALTGHTVNVNTVGYDIIRDQLENQLAAGDAPDVARVTNLGGLNQYYLDLSPYVDSAYWEANYGATLPWFRAADGSDADAVYGWMTGLTVTGPYVNVTYFEDAGVDMPGAGATWDDWAAALMEVKDTLGLDAGLAMDRTAHRWAGPAFSYGAKFFNDAGEPILVDDGFRNYAEVFVGWHESGLMPAEGWPAGADTEYRNAAPLFTSGAVAMHMSGSWMLNNYDANITDFEWTAVPIPCGPGGCGAMPGGAAMVAFNSTDVPEASAMFLDWLASTEAAQAFAVGTNQITAHQGLQAAGIDYVNASAAVSNGLSVFAANAGVAADTTPQAFTFQGYPKNFAIYGTVPDYITQAIKGEISLDAALAGIDADVAAKIAE